MNQPLGELSDLVLCPRSSSQFSRLGPRVLHYRLVDKAALKPVIALEDNVLGDTNKWGLMGFTSCKKLSFDVIKYELAMLKI